MRTLSSILVGILALMALSVFFVLNSVLSYVESPDAVTETAREHALHERALEVAEQILADELRALESSRPQLYAQVRTEAREVFARVFTDEWFYQTFHTGYSSALAIVHGQEPTAVDLRLEKAELGRGLEAVSRKVAARCRELIGGPSCDDEDRKQQMFRPVSSAIRRAVAEIPDRLAIETVAERAGARWLRPDSPQIERARQALHTVHIIRYVALGAMLLFFLVIAISNRPPISRMLVALGLALAITATGFVVAVNIADRQIEALAERAMTETQVRGYVGVSTVSSISAQGAQVLARGFAQDAIHGSDSVVIAIGAAGLLLILLGMLLPRRRRRARPNPGDAPTVGRQARR